jgi:hypothetical protein
MMHKAMQFDFLGLILSIKKWMLAVMKQQEKWKFYHIRLLDFYIRH